jgi:MGT family glycosyltransferase
MGRFLFVVPPMVGHVNPTVAVGRELISRGHDVVWTGPYEVVAEVLPDDLPFRPMPLSADLTVSIRTRAPDRRGVNALRHLIAEFLLPLAEDMLPGVEAAVADCAPDVMLIDQQALAGTAVAAVRGLPWATSATTTATLLDQMELMPRLQEWADGLQRDFLVKAGVDEAVAETLDLRFSPHLVLVFSTEAFVGRSGFPDHYRFVGPSIGARRDDIPFDWDWLDPSTPTVLVSLGTLNEHNGGRFFTAAAQALASMDVQGVVIAPPEIVSTEAPNVLVVPRVPQLALMSHLDAVVSHAGHNTVCEALLHGVPLVVAPIRDDQPAIAEQVVAAGAGIRVKFRRATPTDLQSAITQALTTPSFRQAAQSVQSSFTSAGGPPTAATHLESLL